MTPRFSNPHLLVETARHVSRAEIYAEPDDEGMVSDHVTVDNNALASLESILKRSLGDFQLDVPSTEGPKKKRRKTKAAESEESKPEGVVSFRLLSSSKEPKLVSLLPPPRPKIKSREPPTEDTKEEAKLRTQRAAEVAVDMSWVLNESRKTYIIQPREAAWCEIVRTNKPLSGSPMMILERPTAESRPPLISQHLLEREKPSPHTLNIEKLKYPILTLSTSSPLLEPPESSRPRSSAFKRRLRKLKSQSHDSSQETKPHPTFWRPKAEWRGKSAGYAWGYENSEAVWTEKERWRPYVRDTMTKGTFVV
ncbi:hypothetical protein QCA50_005744 [Cerrena zonata]|uniref:Uncharacterized protein n=1 Tax=Cerrena zonata TaxID=2478898 RepID=A0AAW0GBA3_9APHY